jgi:single-strand DNA-binding protein
MATRNLNKVMLIGNLTRDPEVRYTPQGSAVASFVIATNREWSAGGEKKQAADFHNVVAWNKLAEICSSLLKRGTKVFVEGRLQTRSWQDATDGTKKYKTEVVIDDMIILGSKKDGVEGDSDGEVTGMDTQAPATSEGGDMNFDDFNFDLDSTPDNKTK